MNAGPIIHPPLIILNAGPLEHFSKWDIHNEGTQKSIQKIIYSLDNERITLRKKLNYNPQFSLQKGLKEAVKWYWRNL